MSSISVKQVLHKIHTRRQDREGTRFTNGTICIERFSELFVLRDFPKACLITTANSFEKCKLCGRGGEFSSSKMVWGITGYK
jgi:hypothetical protein